MISHIPYLESERLFLRAFQRDDLHGDYVKWINDPEINQFLVVGAFPQTLDDLEAFYNSHRGNQTAVLFAVIEKETGKHIGTARLSAIDWLARKAGRGVMLGDKSTWGKGYGLEIINMFSDYAFNTLNLNKLYSISFGDNKGIQKVNQRAGYTKEGVLRDMFFRNGRYYDGVYYGLLKKDYLDLRESL